MKYKIVLLLWTASWCFLGIFLGIFMSSITNKSINEERRPFVKEDIYSDPAHIQQQFKSMNVVFDVAYVTNGRRQSFNPGFPSIHITTNTSDYKWLHVIRTDCHDCKYQVFIDTWPEGYPFYTTSSDFVDNPHWSFRLFQRPVSYWIGHAYAVSVDPHHKTIKCAGGISWGYRLSWLSIWLTMQPTMILPSSLDAADWQTDWKVFQEALPDYQDITNLSEQS